MMKHITFISILMVLCNCDSKNVFDYKENANQKNLSPQEKEIEHQDSLLTDHTIPHLIKFMQSSCLTEITDSSDDDDDNLKKAVLNISKTLVSDTLTVKAIVTAQCPATYHGNISVGGDTLYLYYGETGVIKMNNNGEFDTLLYAHSCICHYRITYFISGVKSIPKIIVTRLD